MAAFFDIDGDEDQDDRPGPWFIAGYDGECSRCGDDFEAGARIRADGQGEWECCDEEDAARILAAPMERFTGSSDEDMGF